MKTEAEIQDEIENKAEEFSTYRSDEPPEGLNIHAFDQYVGFKHGVTLGREIERERVRDLIRLIQFEGLPALRQSGLSVSLSNDIQNALAEYQAARGDGHE